MHKQLKRFYAEKDFIPRFETKVPIDEIDNEGLNAGYIGIKTRIDRGKDTISESTKMLIKMGANCDLADR